MPTHNYGRFIGAAIRSVLNQGEDDCEVIVLDGGSTDNTAQVVAEIAAAHPNVKYFYQADRGGIDADLERSVTLAAGDYCWLLSADDALRDGALARVLREFERGFDLLLCNRVWCDAHLQPIKNESWLSGAPGDREVNLADRQEVAGYLTDARSLGALFSFMSCIAFRRAAWGHGSNLASLAGTNYAHVARLFGIGSRGGRFIYLADPLVLCRGGADSFRAGGLASRLLIDLEGYRAIADLLFPDDDALRRAVKSVARKEHPWRRWVRARSETGDRAQWKRIERLLGEFGYDAAAIRLIDPLGRMLRWLRRLVPGRVAIP
jgi:abequosyltransferase